MNFVMRRRGYALARKLCKGDKDMTDIELVIKIPEETYKGIMLGKWDGNGLAYYVKDGTILPKGHGRIGDLDELIQTMKERNDDNGGEPLNAVDRGYDLAYQHMIKEAYECVIIGADKAESEYK